RSARGAAGRGRAAELTDRRTGGPARAHAAGAGDRRLFRSGHPRGGGPVNAVTAVDAAGELRRWELSDARSFHRPTGPLRSRVAYAAAHVVPRVTAENVPGAPADIDWDATLAFRHPLWSWGLGVADAMDPAQRNMGLDAKATRELIARSAAEARAAGGALVVGVNTDHVEEDVSSLPAVIDAY